MTWQEMSGAKGGGREKLFPPGEAVEGVPLPIPPHRSFDRALRSPAPDFPFGGLSPRPVLGPLAGSWWQSVNGGGGKEPRHLTPGCRLRSRCSLRPTVPLSRGLPQQPGKPRASPWTGTARFGNLGTLDDMARNVGRQRGRKRKAVSPQGRRWRTCPSRYHPTGASIEPCGAPPLISPLAGCPPAPFLVGWLDCGGRA